MIEVTFHLSSLLTTTNPDKLESGHEALEKIRQLDQFNADLLEDVTIGYQMKRDSQSLLVDIVPCWYYLYDGVWKSLTFEGSGGDQVGLEIESKPSLLFAF